MQFLLLLFLTPSSCNTDLSDAQPSTDLASAIEWVQSFRSSAAAAANACTQQSACLQAPSSQGECLYSSAAHLILGNDSRPTNSSCSQEQTDAYRSIVDTMHNRFSTHSAILQPLLLSLKNLNQLSSPPLALVHSLTQASQALGQSFSMYSSLLLALAARAGPVSMFSSSPVDDPLLRALQGNGALAELQAAQKTVADIAAVVAAV